MEDFILKTIDNFEIKSIDREARTFWAVASTEEKDRDGDVIASKGWDLKNFKNNPVILWAHDYRELPVAKALNIQKGEGRLRFKPQFAEHDKAKAVFDLYVDGFLKAFSVGFIPKVSEDMEEGGKFYKQAELLEISAVPVPSNPGALAEIRAKGIEAIEKPGFEETENEVRYRVREPGLFQDGSFRRITLQRDKPRVFAVIGRLKGETTTTVQSLRFPKEDDWTIPKARAWVKAHPDAVKFLDMTMMMGWIESGMIMCCDIDATDDDSPHRLVNANDGGKIISAIADISSRVMALENLAIVSNSSTGGTLENSQKALPDDQSGEGVEANPEPDETQPKPKVRQTLTPDEVFKIFKKINEQRLTLAQGGIIDKEDLI